MRLIADVMLGRLAKRLRLRGFDVLYDPGLSDNEIIKRALVQDRLILTRDRGLTARPLARRHLFIESDHVQAQVDQVLAMLGAEESPRVLTRCSVCNDPLIPAARESVKDRVPEYVYDHQTDFLSCPSCGRIYWRGSHVNRMALPARLANKKAGPKENGPAG